MGFLLKKSDKIILFVGICLGAAALLHPYITGWIDSDSPEKNLGRVNGRRFKLEDTAVKVPRLVEEKSGISINSAGVEKLKQLSGVGPVLAKKVISYREQHGGFSSVDELSRVDGIGPATLEKLRKEVSVEG